MQYLPGNKPYRSQDGRYPPGTLTSNGNTWEFTMEKKNNALPTYVMPADFDPYHALDELLGAIKSLHWMLIEGAALEEPVEDQTVHALWGLIGVAEKAVRQFHAYFLAIEDVTNIRIPRTNEDFAENSIIGRRNGDGLKEAAASYGTFKH